MEAKNGVNWEEWGFVVHGECPEYKGYNKTKKNKNRNENISFLPSYKIWQRLVQDDRGHTDKRKVLCEEWKEFYNFRKWYDDNYYEIKGETMRLFYNFFDRENIYLSPETCIYLPTCVLQLKIYPTNSELFDYIVEHESEIPKGTYNRVINYCLEV